MSKTKRIQLTFAITDPAILLAQEIESMLNNVLSVQEIFKIGISSYYNQIKNTIDSSEIETRYLNKQPGLMADIESYKQQKANGTLKTFSLDEALDILNSKAA
jgi:hypothetical protein